MRSQSSSAGSTDQVKWLGGGLLLALAIMVLIAWFTLKSVTGFVNHARALDHSHQVLLAIEVLISQLKDAETGQRGFVLTGDEDFLEPYHAARADLEPQVDRLKQLTAGNPAQRERVERLDERARYKMTLLSGGISLKQDHPGSLDAERWIATGEGRRTMEQVRDLAMSMTRDEQARMARASAVSDRNRDRMFMLILAGNMASITLVGLVFVLLYREIRRRRDAEITVQQHADTVEDLYNHAPCGYHSLDAEGVFMRINDTELKWLGYERDEVLGRMRFSDLLTPEGLASFKVNFPTFKETGELRNLEFDLRRKDESLLPVMLSATAIRDAEGRFLMSRSTLFDITERRQTDLQIAELHQSLESHTEQLEVTNRELESFSYSVSHDLRSPLRAIDGFSRILEEDYAGSLDGEARRLLQVIRDNTQRMGRLIDDLLAFSRLGRKPVVAQHVDMTALANEVKEEVRSEDGAAAVRWTCECLPKGWGDPALLRQVWINLLSNASKFTCHHDEPCVEIGARPDGEFNVYYVRDNGAGFDMRYYDKLFGVFQRLHRQEEFPGTGVGLAIVQRVVTRHGGRVWAEGEPEHGATFYFTLPKGEQCHE